MSSSPCPVELMPGFPRYFKIGRHWVSAYKFFLCIGIYVGTLVSAAVAQASGISPLLMGVGCVSCAILGMFGARIFYLVVFASRFATNHFWADVWNPKRGGWSVFGALIVVPYSFLLVDWLRIPLAVYWDHMIWGIVSGAVFIRFGCVCNGCCSGRRTTKWFGIQQHDTRGNRHRRIPVQWLEIAWWLLALVGLIWFWPNSFASGSYALGGMAWYGLGRFWLEPLRERPDVMAGIRVNQLVAALIALLAGGTLILIW
jgi:prolipoprotein diacylglyceryltransferase